MNIFILDYDKKLNAKAHTNSHIIKMPVELVQILCTNLTSFGYNVPMKPTHLNHPSSVWCRDSYDNMLYTYELAEELCKEYSFRYGKKHQVETYLEEIFDMILDSERFVESIGLTDFAKVVPEHCMKEDAVESYRQYYLVEKLPQVSKLGQSWRWGYKNRSYPIWAKQFENEIN